MVCLEVAIDRKGSEIEDPPLPVKVDVLYFGVGEHVC